MPAEEVFPSLASLESLSGLTDSATGVYYPAKGEGPDWYAAFVKCIYRLVKNAAAVSGLRVYKTGEMTFAVKPGTFFDGTVVRLFQDSIADGLTAGAANSIYLTMDGVVRVSTAGFPDPSATRHIRLAVVQTGNGTFTDDDITDCRQAHLFTPAGPISNLAEQSVASHHLADGVANQLPQAQLSVSGESGNMNTVTIQVRNARNEAVANRYLVQAWLSDSPCAAETPVAPDTATTWTTGTLMDELTARKRWSVLTDASGQAVLSITETGIRMWYLNVAVNGRVYWSPGIAFN